MPRFPAVEPGDGWEPTEETVETLFSLPGLSVEGAIRRFEDRETAAALEAATGVDASIRFFAAARLSFEPGLPPGTLPSAVLPSVRGEAARTFRERLRDRGVRSLERGNRERLRVDGTRVRARSYEGTLPTGGTDLPVEGWVAVWHADGFLVVTGGHPARRLADVFGLEDAPAPLRVPPREYREGFFSLLRSVG